MGRTSLAERKDPPETPRRRLIARLLSEGSLTKKASLNAIAAAVDQGARMLVKLLITPFLVSRLGDSVYGVWQVLRNLIDQAGPVSGRPGEALKWTVAHDQTSTDVERKRRYVGDAVAVWLLFLPLLLVIGAVLAWYAPIWLQIPPDSAAAVRLAGAVLTVDLVTTSLAYLPLSVLQGENLGYRRLGLSTAIIFVQGAVMAGAVALGYGIAGMAVGVLIATALSGIVYLLIVRSQVPWFGVARPTGESVRAFAGLSWWFLVWNLVNRSLIASDVIVLGIAGSAALVTPYSLMRFAPQAVTLTAATLIFAIMPGLGGLIGGGDLVRAERVRGETLALIWLITAVGGAGVILWERSFLRLWVGGGYDAGLAVVVGIVVMTLQLALIRTDANIIDLTLKLRGKVLLGALSSVLSIGLGWLLLDRYGMLGLVVGFILGRSVLSVAYPTMIGRLLGSPLRRQLHAVMRPLIATTLIFAGAAWAAGVVRVDSWIALAIAGAISTLPMAIVAYFVGLPPSMRHRAWIRLRKIVRFR